MLRSLWLGKFLSRKSRNSRRRKATATRRCVRLHLEGLEDRVTPSATSIDVANAVELRNAINNQVNAHPTQQYVINFTGTTYNLGDINNQLVISNTAGVTLQGNGATINAAANNRLFVINAGSDVLFKDLTLQGGNVSSATADVQGGAIKNIGGKVTLSNVTVQNNAVQASNNNAASGGGVYVSAGGTLTIQSSSRIDNNSALGFTANGIEGYAYGGGVYLTGSSVLTIADSSVSGNTAQGGDATSGSANKGYGGGIYSYGAASLSITNSHIDGNHALGGNGIVTAAGQGGADGEAGKGGGLYVNGDGWKVTISGSTLSNNEAIGGYGATGMTGDKGGYGGNASGGGAFIDGDGVSFKLLSSSISDNTARAGAGGSGGIEGGNGGNGANVYGGGIDFEGHTALWTILGSNFSGNQAIAGAGGLGGDGSNGANGGDGGKGGYGGDAKGGGFEFYNSPSSAAITNSSFTGNSSIGGQAGGGGQGGSGGAAGNGGKGGDARTAGDGRGGGIDVYDDFPLTLINTTLGGNIAQGGDAGAAGLGGAGGAARGADGAAGYAGDAKGGGLREIYGKTTLINSTVANNQALAGAGGATTAKGQGGGIYGDDTLLTNVILTGNRASSDGADFFGSLRTTSRNDFISDTSGITGLLPFNGMILDNALPQLGELTTANGLSYYPLLANSAAINAGVNSVLGPIATAEGVTPANATDALGNARVVNNVIDMGAVEFGAATTTLNVDPVTITASPFPTQVQVNAHVLSDTGEPINEGTVKFTLIDGDGNAVGGSVSSVMVNNGLASAMLIVQGNTPAGVYTLKASYSDPLTGNWGGRFGPSDGSATLKINAAVSGTTLTAGNAALTESSSPQTAGVVVLLNSPNGLVDSGTVTMKLLQNGVPLSQASALVSNGSATVSLTIPAGLPAGSYQLLQTYHDDSGRFGDSSGFGSLTLASATPTNPPTDPPTNPPSNPPTDTPANPQATPAPSLFQAVFALYVDAIQLALHQHGYGAQLGLPSPADLLSHISFHLPYAGPFGMHALTAGLESVNQALAGSKH